MIKGGAFLALTTLMITGCQDDQVLNPELTSNNLIEQKAAPQEDVVGYGLDNFMPIPGKYIVVLNENQEVFQTMNKNQTPESAKKQVQEISSNLLNALAIDQAKVNLTYATVLKGFSIALTTDELLRLEASPLVKYVEQDKYVSLANGKGKPGGGGSAAQTTPYGITRVGGAADGTGKTAWVIDSGVDMDHEDLNVDASRSATFLGGNSTPDDQNGHGTHVAGTIGAIDNSVGVVGVAANATIVSVRVLDRRGSGTTSGVIAGVDYVGANGANGDVANMSLGGGISPSLDAAVLGASSSVKFVLAAGNESQNANNSSPARVNGSNIYTVSAIDINDNWAYFSNYANPPVDWCAPGVSIHSTWKGNGYNTISGTSMAAPHVAGILLLGNIAQSGNVNGDPDGNPDKIASR